MLHNMIVSDGTRIFDSYFKVFAPLLQMDLFHAGIFIWIWRKNNKCDCCCGGEDIKSCAEFIVSVVMEQQHNNIPSTDSFTFIASISDMAIRNQSKIQQTSFHEVATPPWLRKKWVEELYAIIIANLELQKAVGTILFTGNTAPSHQTLRNSLCSKKN